MTRNRIKFDSWRFLEEILKFNSPTSGLIFGGFSVLTLQMSNVIHQGNSLPKLQKIFSSHIFCLYGDNLV